MSDKIEPEFGWAAFCTEGKPHPFIVVNSVSRYASQTRKFIGDAWKHNDLDETWQDGWKRAYRAGWRVIRVKVEAAFVGGRRV